jgi:hypothetical protein
MIIIKYLKLLMGHCNALDWWFGFFPFLIELRMGRKCHSPKHVIPMLEKKFVDYWHIVEITMDHWNLLFIHVYLLQYLFISSWIFLSMEVMIIKCLNWHLNFHFFNHNPRVYLPSDDVHHVYDNMMCLRLIPNY